MSNEHAIALIMAIFIPGMLLYALLDRTYQARLDAVATGVVHGVEVPAKYRELLLYTRLLPFILVVISPLVFCGIGMMLLARSIPDEDVRLLAYLAVFLNASGAAGWLLIGFAQVFYFKSLLRSGDAN